MWWLTKKSHDSNEWQESMSSHWNSFHCLHQHKLNLSCNLFHPCTDFMTGAKTRSSMMHTHSLSVLYLVTGRIGAAMYGMILCGMILCGMILSLPHPSGWCAKMQNAPRACIYNISDQQKIDIMIRDGLVYQKKWPDRQGPGVVQSHYWNTCVCVWLMKKSVALRARQYSNCCLATRQNCCLAVF
jgi:hypothetical protein